VQVADNINFSINIVNRYKLIAVLLSRLLFLSWAAVVNFCRIIPVTVLMT